ncbi:MAG: class I SAM-dependent methyltransferase [Saprospiraceae bacterium]|nr:class I SAM-dependent methyltransferase [Saprospiraceae bacterium]
MNYFSSNETAARYSKGRPNFHPVSIQKIKTFLQIEHKLERVVDIACGTGLSTEALLDIAENVFGTDTSPEMLKNARSKEVINYAIAQAEKQPFEDNTFDLVTVCSAVHWFRIDDFLLEANRLLKSKAFLVLYDNYFISEMEGVPEFSDWFPEIYLKRFPSPKRRNDYDWSNSNLRNKNFSVVSEDHFKNEITFTKHELILYLTSQSNITDAVIRGEKYPEIEFWLNQELSQFFAKKNSSRIIYFGNWMKYLKRNA